MHCIHTNTRLAACRDVSQALHCRSGGVQGLCNMHKQPLAPTATWTRSYLQHRHDLLAGHFLVAVEVQRHQRLLEGFEPLVH